MSGSIPERESGSTDKKLSSGSITKGPPPPSHRMIWTSILKDLIGFLNDLIGFLEVSTRHGVKEAQRREGQEAGSEENINLDGLLQHQIHQSLLQLAHV